MTIDTFALLFELEVKAASESCVNCGHDGLTVTGENHATIFVNGMIDMRTECQCLRCHARAYYTFTFTKEDKICV